VPEAPIDGVPYTRKDANWVATTSLAATPGDVKDSFAVNDHGGWILLNGRLVNTLSSTQQANAALLGFTTNIPNATGAVTIQNGSAMGTVAGSMTKTIAVANLPAHNMTSGGHDAAAVTSSSSGAHTHTTDSQPNLSMGTGATRGRTATGNTGYYFTDAEGANHKSIAHTHTAASAGAHTHTVDLPNHTHTVALGGSGTPLDVTPKSMSINKFVFLGA